MNFVIERMNLTDPHGAIDWSATPMLHPFEADGSDACGALAAVVAGDGATQVGITAAYKSGEAVMVAQKGVVVYALRAVPAER